MLRVAAAAPADTFSEVLLNPDDYNDDDVFVPASDKENFDLFDWQLCKVNLLFYSKTTNEINRL
jgi:hypothetical protein